ncbi:MAG TPA: hypothetical protein EYG98_06355, partial [Sulfurovum sp.]|nr:hypothetical protein [Sulfurovum sp.]
MDTDGDGEPDYADSDDDGDGTSDIDETANGTDPLVNAVPIANAGADQTLNKMATVALDGTGSSDDSASMSYLWTLAMPAGSTAVLSSATGEVPTFVADKVGVYTASLVVDDGVHSSVADSIDITVLDTVVLIFSDTESGFEPWVTNGLDDGTTARIKDINTEETEVTMNVGSDMVEMNGKLYFVGSDGISGGLWMNDGTGADTVLIKKASSSFVTKGKYLMAVNDMLFFLADDGTHGYELWKSDGTEAGTMMVKDIGTAGSSSMGKIIATKSMRQANTDIDTPKYRAIAPEDGLVELTAVNGVLYFSADDGTNGRELWTSDGTEDGTKIFKNINTDASSNPRHLTDVNGSLYFVANDGIYGNELWMSNGTVDGTEMVKDIRVGADSSSLNELAAVKDTLYFTCSDGATGTELWISNGTAIGTKMVKDIRVGTDSSRPEDLTNVNGTLYFTAFTDDYGRELWTSDGSEANTKMVKDIKVGTASSIYNRFREKQMTAVGDTLYFTANDGGHGKELWRSDGTEVGTKMVKDICVDACSSDIEYLTAVNGMLYFSAMDAENDRVLWTSDGEEVGTRVIKDASLSSPRHLTAFNTMLYF